MRQHVTTHLHTENAEFQALESLKRNRNRRHKERRFFVEGVRQIDRVLAYGWSVESVLLADGAAPSSWAEDILQRSGAKVRYVLSPRLLEKLSNKNEPSELLAIVDMPPDDLHRIPRSALPLIVVVDRSDSPGNLGTMIRTCDALGVDGLIMTGHSVDLYDPQTIAASTGSLFALPVVRAGSHEDLLPFFRELRDAYGDLQLVGTSAHARQRVYEAGFWRPTVLLIGNERDGLSRAYRDLADVMLSIPVQGSASSLNVACAASVVLYEVHRQRGR